MGRVGGGWEGGGREGVGGPPGWGKGAPPSRKGWGVGGTAVLGGQQQQGDIPGQGSG